VHFVRDILEAHGFRITINQDALRARLEHHEATVMERSLRVLGYVIVHTRQLDMIMANASVLQYYRHRIETQIATMLAEAPSGIDHGRPPDTMEAP
jgi:pyruvate, water dikinase